MPHSPTRHATILGPSLVVGGLVCQELGASLAVLLFPAVGPIGMVTLRLVISAIILVVVVRPSLRRRSAVAWRSAVLYGLVLAAMNVFFYLALARLPLGATVTIELLGPLVVSVLADRRRTSLVWAALAAAGVALLSGGLADDLDPLGVLFALGAAAMWALYILAAQATGRHFPGVAGLAIGTAVGALGTVPLALVLTDVRALLDPVVLAAGLGIALLSSTIPYALEFIALRRMHAATFAIVLALAPVIAALTGWIVLGQDLSATALVGIACVVLASIGAIGRSPDPARTVVPDTGAATEDDAVT